MLKDLDWQTSPDKVELLFHWRVVTAVLVGATVGPFVFYYLFRDIGSWKFWSGGVTGATVGLFIGYLWQLRGKSRRHRTSGKLLVMTGIAWSLLCMMGLVNLILEKETLSRKQVLITELRQRLRNPPEEIMILPLPRSKKSFEYRINDVPDLKRFTRAIRLADTRPISGHSGPIYECTVLLKTDHGELRYLATVHEYEKEDLFLSNYRSANETSRTGLDEPVRIPGLGKWIMDVAPKGALFKNGVTH